MATEMTTTEETETTETVTSEDVRALAREDVSGDVTRSVAERGFVEGTTTEMATEMTTTEETETNGDSDERGLWLNAVATMCHLTVRVARARDRASRQPRRPRRRRRFVEGTTTEMATEMTTTEETETTETVTSEDVRALVREDVSGNVTRSVAERGGYAVSSGCTSGAGTGSGKQTTETSEETETFCRGYHYEMATDMTTTEETETTETVTSEDEPWHPEDGTTTEMATEMTTTEETENDGDSDEQGRESLGTRRREWRRGPQSG
ncbi:hypothetical protein GN958_ATG21995 [Phytophthora infestans]|uniref:Uncharacterized protein n=1 Tax=Phytophthora infestans TaxID=4787 RepID=A0A8S9TQI6_PHYIN|nr:hypothetical protein GN958_ATG21995 [Phytophthora infestans]